jgi:hypothetical protein
MNYCRRLVVAMGSELTLQPCIHDGQNTTVILSDKTALGKSSRRESRTTGIRLHGRRRARTFLIHVCRWDSGNRLDYGGGAG